MLTGTVVVLAGLLSAVAGTVRVEPVSPMIGEPFRVFAEAGEGETLNCTLTVVTPTAMESLSCRAPEGRAAAPGSYRVVARFSSASGDTQAEARFAVTQAPPASPSDAAAAKTDGPLVRVPKGERVSTPIPKRPRVVRPRRRNRRRAAPPPVPRVDLEVVGAPLVGNTLDLVLRGDRPEDAPTGLIVQSPSGESSLKGPGPFRVALLEPGPWTFLAVHGGTSLDRADVTVPDPTLVLKAPETVPLGETATLTARVEQASPAVDWSYSVVLSSPGGDQTVLTRQGGGWSFSVTDAGPWMIAAVASAPAGLMELAAQEVTGGDLSLVVTPSTPAVGGSSLVDVLDGPLVGELELLVSSPSGGTDVLDGPRPWTVPWTVSGNWTLLLRSTHEGKTHEATAGVVVQPGSLARMPTEDAPANDTTQPPSPTESQDPFVEEDAPEAGNVEGAVVGLLLSAAGLAGLFAWLWMRRPSSPAPVEIKGVHLQRGPTRVQSTGAGLRSLRVSLVVDRGPTRVSLRTDTAQEAS